MNREQAEDRHKLIAVGFKRLPDAEIYACGFGRGSGWAYLIIDESSGIVSIVSDYGSWSNIWTPKAHGRKSLKHFMVEGDFDYMARKFIPGEKMREFDGQKTIDYMKVAVIENRRARDFDKDKARELWDRIDAMDPTASSEGFFHDIDKEVGELFDWDYGGIARYSQTSEFLWLKYGVLPALVRDIKKTLSAEVTA